MVRRNNKRTKARSNWKHQSSEELRDKYEYMEYLLDIEDEETSTDSTSTASSNIKNAAISPPSSTDATVNSELNKLTVASSTSM